MLTVRDPQRSLVFYRDHLGFTQLESDILPLLTLGGLRLYLVPRSPPTGGAQHVFQVSSDLRWTHVRLRIYPDGGVAGCGCTGWWCRRRSSLPG